ncbi:YHS domain-containing (seleno)protein [Flagellimonas algicola]|uniref:YHS domain-containing protein n=1 Tax=Flagellimonas algicola TaxID=2583815 RepID=A0ABY2WI90_9FLAO|nr:YHS domain-containing (seleno)protein [Allomuricauda algicola]TMU50889.1 YHS domain-containing protein [Allomuricauda algicola]
MKRILILAFLFTGALIYGQSKHVNTKKGFAANGYDVVAYFNGQAEEGSKKYKTNHAGIDYKFSSEENLNAFKANPEKFVPQYGGYCAYAVAVSGKRVNVNPETFEIRDDKLYLFYNSGNTNTLELWLKESPEKLRTKADQNWNNLIAD